MPRFVVGSCLAFALFAPLAQADGPADGNAAAKAIAPFIDEQAFAVVRVDLKAFDVDELSGKFSKLSGMPEKNIAEPRKHIRDVLAQLTKAGASDLYVVISLADLPMPGPFVVATVAPGGDAAAIAKVFEGLNMEGTLERNGAVAAGPKTSLGRLKSMTPSARADACRARSLRRVALRSSSTR